MDDRTEPEGELRALLEKLGIEIADWGLIKSALTHPSFTFEHPEIRRPHNQRLEFLGDAVLNLLVAEEIYRRYPHRSEGELTRLRSLLVCEGSLAEKASRLKLGRCLFLGRGEELTGGRKRPSVLADALEALIAAVYVDQGLEAARKLVVYLFGADIKRLNKAAARDYKSALQEAVQKQGPENVEYDIISERGPAHAKEFEVVVKYRDRVIGRGRGRSRKEAEQQAARHALGVMGILPK